MRLSTKRILSIGVSVILILAALITFFSFVMGELKQVTAKRDEVASKANTLETERRVVAQAQELIGRFKDLSKLEGTVSLAMPKGEETTGALRQVEAIQRASAVALSSLSFQRVEELPQLKRPRTAASASSFTRPLGILVVQISAAGTYQSLKRFLQMVETSIRVANVTSLTFTPSATRRVASGTAGEALKPAASEGNDTLSATVEMYYQQP